MELFMQQIEQSCFLTTDVTYESSYKKRKENKEQFNHAAIQLSLDPTTSQSFMSIDNYYCWYQPDFHDRYHILVESVLS